MRIAILGGGRVGSALAATWTARGHEVAVSERGTLAETAASGDVVVLSLPARVVPEALAEAAPLDGKILIDATNNVSGGPGGLEIAALAPAARYVKAFNTVFSTFMHDTPPERPASLVLCGDDEEAKASRGRARPRPRLRAGRRRRLRGDAARRGARPPRDRSRIQPGQRLLRVPLRAQMRRHSVTSAEEQVVGPVTESEEEKRTEFIELFFDLVFVFAFTQVTTLALEDTSAAGFARAALVFALIWWAWSAYAWLTDAIDVENIPTRLFIFGAMLAAFFMALAVPNAFSDEARWFVVSYFVVRVLHDRALRLGRSRRSRPAGRGRPARSLVPRRADDRPRRGASWTTPRGRRSGSSRSWSTSSGTLFAGAGGRFRVARVALRRALCADRDHRARRVDRRHRPRRGGADRGPRLCARGSRRVRRGRRGVVGVLRLGPDRRRSTRSHAPTTRPAGRSPATPTRSSTTRSCSGSSSWPSPRRRRCPRRRSR